MRAEPRNARVNLSSDIARCEPRLHCPVRVHCARYMAAVPLHGAVMMDGTSDLLWSPSGCPHYLPAVEYVHKKYEAPERRVKPWPAVESEW